MCSLGRTHINSCDFSVKSYSFDDTDGDFNLDNFDNEVTHDLNSGMIDMMAAGSTHYKLIAFVPLRNALKLHASDDKLFIFGTRGYLALHPKASSPHIASIRNTSQ